MSRREPRKSSFENYERLIKEAETKIYNMIECTENQPKDMYDDLIQWTSPKDGVFVSAGNSYEELPSGTYEIHRNEQLGYYFRVVKTKTEDLLEFPDSSMDEVISEIKYFWDNQDLYKQYGIAYRRGILLYGPQGSGKTTTLRFLAKDVVSRGGMVINYTGAYNFKEGMRMLRKVQPETPVVVFLEDLDSILQDDDESQLLNILDGNEECYKVVFVATTNFPDELKGRISNRPSRFDKRVKIGFLNGESRKMYFTHLFGDNVPDDIDLDEWVEKTVDFSMAHMKELFVSVVIYGNELNDVVGNLEKMQITPEFDNGFRKKDSHMGFGR